MKAPATLIALRDLCGIAEVSEIIDRSKGRVGQLLLEDPTFPQPVWSLRLGRIWDANEVKAWMQATGYGMAGPDEPKSERNRTGPKPTLVVQVPEAERAARLDALLRG